LLRSGGIPCLSGLAKTLIASALVTTVAAVDKLEPIEGEGEPIVKDRNDLLGGAGVFVGGQSLAICTDQ